MEKIKKNKGGRPPKEIDLEVVNSLCELQCTEAEILSVLKVSDKTFLKELRAAGYESFYEYFGAHGGKGRVSLRRAQWKSAEDGSVQMQIWLGKQYLNQKEKSESETLFSGKLPDFIFNTLETNVDEDEETP